MIDKEMQKIIYKSLPVLKNLGVVHSAIFGSFARGEARKDSDLDILVQLQDNKTLLDLIALRIELEKILGVKVDLLTYDSISPYLKDIIKKEAINIL